MAGRGFAPRPVDRKVGHSRNATGPLRVITAEPTEQPELPELMVEDDGELVEFRWPAQTVTWWRMWRDSPLSAEFTSTDWSELLNTALLHAKFWRGDTKLAAELRLRVAKFGATPEDRARLKITFAMAEDAESRTAVRVSARDRRGPLKAAGQ